VVDGSRDAQRAAARHRLDGVARDVPEDLADLVGIADDHVLRRVERALDRVLGAELERVREQVERLREAGHHVELDRAPFARPDELKEVLDRLVEPVRLLEDDRHEPLLLRREPLRLLEHLDRSGDRGERIADLVRDAGRKLADRRHPILQAQLLLESLHVGQVLEDDADSRRLSVERVERRDRVSDRHRLAAADVVLRLAAHDSPCEHRVAQLLPVLLRKQLEVGERPPDELDRGAGEDLAGRGIRERDDPRRRDGDEPRRDRGDDVLVERLELRQAPAVGVELERRHAELLRHVRGQQRRRVEAGEVRRHVEVEPERGERSHGKEALLGHRNDSVVEQVAEAGVEDHASRGRKQATAPVEKHRRGDDRDEIEEREGRIEPAGEVDEKRLDEQVTRDLYREIERPVEDERRDDEIDDRQPVRQRGDEVEVVDRQELVGRELDDENDDEQRRHRDDADRDEGADLGENSEHRQAAVIKRPEARRASGHSGSKRLAPPISRPGRSGRTSACTSR